MSQFVDDDIPYLLLTPGPLTTSKSVKRVMLNDFCTWDDDYNQIVTSIRQRLVELATPSAGFTAVLMQGSGTFSVEATLGSVVPRDGKVLVVNNGAYGARIGQICERLQLAYTQMDQPETELADLQQIEMHLGTGDFTHFAMVHCETTTGMLNQVVEAGEIAKRHNVRYIVDAMSSFGGIPMSMDELNADYLISSANKCIQGVPGFGFVIARQSELEKTAGWARSLSLDLFDQWQEMENKNGKWRYTSPTHVVRAFQQALDELDAEGGVIKRHARYLENQQSLVAGLSEIGFQTLLPPQMQSPIITAFLYPDDSRFEFRQLYDGLKKHRFVIYPGKVSQAETFRVGNIGHVFPDDIRKLVEAFALVKKTL